jgi:hypothetical protein
VVRQGPLPINESVGGRFFKADGVTPMSSTEQLTCTFRSTTNPNARTARGVATVTRVSDGVVVFSAQSPNTAGAASAFFNNQSGPWSTSWAIPADTLPGLYTITSTAENRRRVSALNPCQLEVAVLDTKTIEYRPWQVRFMDVFGGGAVNMNLVPDEFQQQVGSANGAVWNGTDKMSFYAVPGEDFIALPPDPNACGADPTTCLPSTAVECDPADGCEPRIVIIQHTFSTESLYGFFDLDTGAFVALANIRGNQRLLLSLGREQDGAYRELLKQLAAAAAEQGVDLATLLATTVRVRTGTDEVTLSLLNGLQISPAPGKPAGVQIVSDFTAQAGLILDIYANLDLTGPRCLPNTGDSSPTTPAPDRYAAQRDVGYTVQRSDLLPDVPRVGPVGALVGGPIYHITGDFVGSGSALVNTAAAVIGVDTAADEPNGYPVWIEPFVSTPTHVTAPRTMDFIGTATWSASETPVSATAGCLTVDFLLGAGVALYNNPLPVGFGTLPVWDPTSPEVAALIDQIDATIQAAVDGITSDPTVADVLAQITGALPDTGI